MVPVEFADVCFGAVSCHCSLLKICGATWRIFFLRHWTSAGCAHEAIWTPDAGFHETWRNVGRDGQPGYTWTSQRDHLLLTMLYNTGARASEIIGVKVADVVLDETACVHLRGKGRKQRSAPLWKSTIQAIRAWLRRNPMLGADAALPHNRDGNAMTRFNVTQHLNIAVFRAALICSNLSKRKASPHAIRHTTAMHLLQSGVAFSVIALWLGHESTTTIHRYIEADLAMKEKALTHSLHLHIGSFTAITM